MRIFSSAYVNMYVKICFCTETSTLSFTLIIVNYIGCMPLGQYLFYTLILIILRSVKMALIELTIFIYYSHNATRSMDQ